jgi:hypothetical protein
MKKECLEINEDIRFPKVFFSLSVLAALSFLVILLITSNQISMDISLFLIPGVMALLPLFLLPIVFFRVLKRRREILEQINQAIQNGEFISTESFQPSQFLKWQEKTSKSIKRRTCRGILNVLLGCTLVYVSILLIEIVVRMIYIEDSTSLIPYGIMPLGAAGLLYTIFIHFSDKCAFTQEKVEGVINASIFLQFPFATRSFTVYSGELNPSYWGDGRIIEGLKYLKDKGTKLKIYCTDPETFENKNATNDVKQLVIDKYFRKGIGDIFNFLPKDLTKHAHYMIGTTNILGLPFALIRVERKHEAWWERLSHTEGVRNSLYFWEPSLYWQLRIHLKKIETESKVVKKDE